MKEPILGIIPTCVYLGMLEIVAGEAHVRIRLLPVNESFDQALFTMFR